MNEIETRLDPGQFIRIHRCVIVNVDRVREIRPAPHGESSSIVVLKDGATLRLSRSRRDKMEEFLIGGPEPAAARVGSGF